MKAIIEKKANKYSPVLLVNGTWIKCTPQVYEQAISGRQAELKQDEKGIIVSYDMLDAADGFNTSFPSVASGTEQLSKDVLIVRQSCIKAAVELVCNDKLEFAELATYAQGLEDFVFRK